MSVYSMTGYASGRLSAPDDTTRPAATSDAPVRLVLEIRSVNSRFLDLTFRLSDELRQHETALRELLRKRLRRGKVELRASMDRINTSTLHAPPLPLLQQLVTIQDRIHDWLPDAGPLSVADVLRLSANSNSDDPSLPAETVLSLAKTVLQDFVAARAREGARLRQLLQERITTLRELVLQAKPLIPAAIQAQQQRFITRWDEALAASDGQVASSSAQERALSEAAAFAIRIDVAEELERLVAHLDEIDDVLTKGGELGRRLDFLIQELHREANTLGSKSTTLELSRISVEMKVLIEQMREQVQNIE